MYESWNVRPVDDRDRGGADTPGDPDLLVALEQRVIEAAVGIYFALQNIILNASATKVENGTLELSDPTSQGALGRGGGAIIGEQGADPAAGDLRSFTADLAIKLIDPRAQAQHVGVVGFISVRLS